MGIWLWMGHENGYGSVAYTYLCDNLNKTKKKKKTQLL